eukprot:CCRYP_003237-RA/>CCRYP_003237-RA protein AED:0.49 eAED:0.30 QI:0/0/0/0.75/1/1/4/0/697
MSLVLSGILEADCLRLLPVSSPCLEVAGPSVFSEGKLVRRLLSQDEFLSIYDVPSVLFDTLQSCGHWGVNHPLPFESAPSPVILTSLFRQLWSDGGVCVLETLESVVLSPEVPTIVSSDLGDEKLDCSAEAVKDDVECNMPRPMQDTTIPVPLGVLLYPNDDRVEFDDDTKDLCSTLPLLIDRSDSDDTTVTDVTYRSYDTESDDDSFMPRRKACLKKPIHSSNINKWEFLNDVSMDANITLETEEATESITSFGGRSYSNSCLFTTIQSTFFKTLSSVEEATIGKKAVKADDSKVPKHLWNDRIKSKVDDTTKERFLDSSRELELRVFCRALYLDCMEHLDAEFGIDWRSQEQRKGKYRLNRLGKEVDAIRNILWHASETNFFEYLSGSRLHFFRWPGSTGNLLEMEYPFFLRSRDQTPNNESLNFQIPRMTLIAEEVIRGDKADSMNPFQWNSVRLNLPGTSSYDPTTSWIAKVREDGLVACELFTFVDDERVTGATEELTWLAAHVMAAKQAYLGIQDAARKADECSQQPRAWAGAVVHVVEDKGVCVLTSEEKWRKMKDILKYWSDVVQSGETRLDHKRLLSDRGFLVYVTRAYPPLIPYVKGFHLTAEMWRGNRDADGWKLPPEKMTDKMEMDDGVVIERDEDEAAAAYSMRKLLSSKTVLHAPMDGVTQPAPRLMDNLKALIKLTSSALPL